MNLFPPVLAFDRYILNSLPPDQHDLLQCVRHPVDFTKLNSTYSLVQVDGVFACDDISDGRALSLAGGLLGRLGGGGHFY